MNEHDGGHIHGRVMSSWNLINLSVLTGTPDLDEGQELNPSFEISH